MSSFWVGVIISAVISGIFSESIVKGISHMLSKIDLPNKAYIEGIWKAEFTMKEANVINTYTETIKVVKRLGILYGYNIPDPDNHELLKKVEMKKPLRIRANMVDNRFITGVWFHPNKKSRFHGSFQLKCELSGNIMEGVWTGYTETYNEIGYGKWNWVKKGE